MKVYIILAILFLSLFAINFTFGLGIKTPPGIDGLADIIYTRGWALAIGVEDYTPSEFQRKYAGSDADAVAKLLTSKYGFDKENVMTLKNKDATKQNIMAGISSLAEPRKISMEDCLLIYFCGQGVTFTNEKGDYGFLVPYNTKFDLAKEYTYEDYKENCISIYSIQRALRFVKARHILIIADAYFGGVLINIVRSTGSEIANPLLRVAVCKGFQVLVASEKDEKLKDNDDVKHGIFTYTLIKALEENKADENNNGLTEASELATYLTKEISKATNGKQEPKFIHTGDGEFMFVPQTEIELPIKD